MAADQPRSAHATPAPFADSVPSLVENAPVSLDVLSQRLEREMWRRERQVQVERVVTVLAGMALQPVDGMAGDRRSGIEAVALLRRRKPLIVQQMHAWSKETVLVKQAIRVIESGTGQREKLDVPFA